MRLWVEQLAWARSCYRVSTSGAASGALTPFKTSPAPRAERSSWTAARAGSAARRGLGIERRREGGEANGGRVSEVDGFDEVCERSSLFSWVLSRIPEA